MVSPFLLLFLSELNEHGSRLCPIGRIAQARPPVPSFDGLQFPDEPVCRFGRRRRSDKDDDVPPVKLGKGPGGKNDGLAPSDRHDGGPGGLPEFQRTDILADQRGIAGNDHLVIREGFRCGNKGLLAFQQGGCNGVDLPVQLIVLRFPEVLREGLLCPNARQNC